MSDCKSIALIRESLSSVDALRIVNAVAGAEVARIERRIYYPYFHFSAVCSARTLFGTKPISASCLVDGCNEAGATADPVVAEQSEVARDAILRSKIDARTAMNVARRFLIHTLGRRLRTIGNFNVNPEAQGLVRKAFWLIRCEDTVVMVDSLTGCLHTLGKRAA